MLPRGVSHACQQVPFIKQTYGGAQMGASINSSWLGLVFTNQTCLPTAGPARVLPLSPNTIGSTTEQ